MNVELVRATTPDGLRLDGALCLPPPETAAQEKTAAVDVVLCLHGVGGNFYGSSLLWKMAPFFLNSGIAVLVVNTRGHDGMYNAGKPSGVVRQGAAYEIVDKCRFDVYAWLDFLSIREYKTAAVLGHSLGAIKALYSQAHHPHSICQRVAAVSPPLLSCEAFCDAPQGPQFMATMAMARQSVKQGDDETLIESSFPFPLLITAEAYVDKYGVQERYNILKFAADVNVPTLFVYGGLELSEGGVAFAGLPQSLAALEVNETENKPQFEFAEIEKANHFYLGVQEKLACVVCDWLQSDESR